MEVPLYIAILSAVVLVVMFCGLFMVGLDWVDRHISHRNGMVAAYAWAVVHLSIAITVFVFVLLPVWEYML